MSGWDVEAGRDAYDADGHCWYSTVDGRREPGCDLWEGTQTARQGDRIGMLLDLDQGSMVVYKNDVLMGAIQSVADWSALLGGGSVSVRIESVQTPESPTEEELAAAKEAADGSESEDDSDEDE